MSLAGRGVVVTRPRELAPAFAELLERTEMQHVAGKRVLIVRGEGGRELLGESLAARGALVEYAQCYRRVRPAIDAAPLLAAWRRGELDAVTVLSAQALDNFIDLT